MSEHTAVGRVWLWFRFVLGTFTGGILVTAIVWLIRWISDLYSDGQWLPATTLLVIPASLVVGTLMYLGHRSDNPGKYK